ncbi:MAG: PmeII family type II restriction endonuclease [Bacteroidota bacterium]
MNTISPQTIRNFLKTSRNFYGLTLLSVLNKLEFDRLVENINPYVHKNNCMDISKIITGLIEENLKESEDAIQENILKEIAIIINKKIYNGWKSSFSGIDLEFDRDNIRYLVTIKTEPNWGNNSQIKKLESDFNNAINTLHIVNSNLEIATVNGCCYGRNKNRKKRSYSILCGQEFWEFISGDSELDMKIIDALGHKAKERNEDFIKSYSKMINLFTYKFLTTFCRKDGSVDWDKLVRFNSAIIKPKI